MVEQKVKRRCVRIGFNDLEWSYNKQSFISIQGKLVFRGSGLRLFSPGLTLVVAKGAVAEFVGDFSCSHNDKIQVFKSLTVGKDNMWSYDVIVMDTDAHKIFNSEGEMISHNSSIVFGDHVWLGCRSIVLKGVTIPNGCVIGAGSIVSKSLQQEKAVYIGQRRLRENIDWSKEMNFD